MCHTASSEARTEALDEEVHPHGQDREADSTLHPQLP